MLYKLWLDRGRTKMAQELDVIETRYMDKAWVLK